MTPHPGRLLLIDDNPDDRALVVRALSTEVPDLEVEQASDRASFLAGLERPDLTIVITDYALRWTTGLEVLAEVRARSPELPVIMFTGTGSEEIAVAAMKAGLTDYIVKAPKHFGRLPFAVQAALEQQRQRGALRATEALLQHAQKMEALGRLAGGIAHDFNNLLMAIRGHAELLRMSLGDNQSAREDLDQIIKAADNGAALTKQLLRFSRREPATMQTLDLGSVVTQVIPMLRRLLGPEIELTLAPGPGLHAIAADHSQLDQILVNLAVNARDAMPNGGRLTIEVEGLDVDGERAADLGLMPGPFVQLAVADTGVGMDPETQVHIFEPFYTTKSSESGTGLGLATVYSIVTAARGAVYVESRPGAGARFVLLWPSAGAS